MHPIRLRGARTHHLKRIDVELVPGELVAITGPSGSGKSSLAFDTLYSEGQRRFVESFSPYARQFLERLERPPMDELDPVAAGIAVDRRAPIKSSRSTLATMADLEAYLSALFAREAVPMCSDCGRLAERLDADHAAAATIAEHDGDKAIVSYPLVVAGTEHYLDVRDQLLRDGYRRLFAGGEVRELDGLRPSEAMGGAAGTIDVVVDRLKIAAATRRRLAAALEDGWGRGDGAATLHLEEEGGFRRAPLARGLSCPGCARRFAPARPGLFSYQSPVGACSDCRGFGRVLGIDWERVVPDGSLTIAGGAVRAFSGRKAAYERRVLVQWCGKVGIAVDKPWRELTAAQQAQVIDGEGSWRGKRYGGLRSWFRWLEGKSYKMHVRVFLARYRSYEPCTACGGKRLAPESLGYRVAGLDLGDWHGLELREARRRLSELQVSGGQGATARAELLARLSYLERVGLGYLTLDRQARTLSGGEAQRVSLTAALGSSLTGALFVLDEPTVGLHPSDLPPLTEAMRELATRGNVVLVVEHEPSVIAAADRVIELGPGAGRAGGEIVFDGPPAALARRRDLASGRALATPPAIADRPALGGGRLTVRGARAHNLRDVTVSLPLGAVVAVCGPSGSGKSSLIEDVLYRALGRARGEKDLDAPGEHAGIDGDRVVHTVTLVDQSPLGRTSRGNAATYSGAWTRLRALFAAQPDAQMRGLSPASFSFNVAGGRCEACNGEGAETVEMQFLADVRLLCGACQGKRFRPEVLSVKLRGRSVSEVLDMSVEEALEVFDLDNAIAKALSPIAELGLGYLPLGQPLSTLSGGEAQRLKLARALGEVGPGTLLLLDEPSAGLHAEEVGLLTAALRELVRQGGSVVVVEHDLAVIGAADWVIELGPGAGTEGGQVVFQGTAAQLARDTTRTGRSLAEAAARAERIAAAPVKKKSENGAAALRAIEVRGAREHNLRGLDVAIPHGELVVVTGPSGSGKSSLAFDVVFAEGQRRFLETLTPYARQFLPTLPRPDADSVSGVPPSVALEQRTARAGVNSTVATVTEIAHYLRLLFAKVGDAHCPTCDLPIAGAAPDEVYATLVRRGGRYALRAPVVRARKGTYLDVFTSADRAGIEWAVCDGALVATDRPPRLAKTKEHSIDLIVYEGDLAELDRERFDRALVLGKGQVVLAPYRGKRPSERDDGKEELYSTTRACPQCGKAVPELDPRWFSFNTKQGRCEPCEGTGYDGGESAVSDAWWRDDFESLQSCDECGGSRLAPIPRAVRLDGERYHELGRRSVAAALERVKALRFTGPRARIAEAPLAELRRRLEFVAQVGLGYLGLDRPARTLSGGEMQRLRLAAQLGAGLTGALYVLDEPTIGLHPRDTGRLLANLRALCDTGSTVLVVEHDAETIRAADYLIDLGPAGGRGGGRVVAAGRPRDVLRHPDSPTGKALGDERALFSWRTRREPGEEAIVLSGARANNLRVDSLRIPTGRMVVVAGVSGSGKSTLVGEVLFPAVRAALGRTAPPAGRHDSLELPRALRRAIAVDQSPIGRTSRSVPATFLGVFDHLRRLFAGSPEARTRGYGPARFSFNSAQGRGRCPACNGNGVIVHEMAFLPDAQTPCDGCGGLRFEPGTLEVRYLGLSIGEVLRLTAQEAAEVFHAHRAIGRPLATLCELGVGYLQLGQGSPTLSGGEAQRLKLAAELTAGGRHEPTLYVLDEPTTGLHHGDVGKLLRVLDRLVERGDSLVIIEHHPAVIAAADWVIELGPEGGDAGGRVVAEGAPTKIARARTATGQVLARLFGDKPQGRRAEAAAPL